MPAAPDVARIGTLIGDPARAAMLSQLAAGRAFTATELARAARVTKQTTSSHLRRLVDGGLVAVESQGRHRYFRLTGPDVAAMLERVMGVAIRVGALRTDPGPAEAGLRRARVCYDHLAGELAVWVFDALLRRRLLRPDDRRLTVTDQGQRPVPGLSRLERTPAPSGRSTRSRVAGSLHRSRVGQAPAGHPRDLLLGPGRAGAARPLRRLMPRHPLFTRLVVLVLPGGLESGGLVRAPPQG
jgi:DNA-binding transcriptional ArsR family regulator